MHTNDTDEPLTSASGSMHGSGTRPRKVRQVGATVLLVISSAAFSLGIAEFVLRFFYPQGGSPKIYEFDPKLGHRNQSNIDIVHVWNAHENVSRLRTNSIGFRGPEVPGIKQSGEFRILLLGDSYTFGYGVDEEDTFAHLLANELNSDPANPRSFRTINAGVSSYGTAQEILQYELVGRKLEPDLVILNMFLGNDVQENLCQKSRTLRPTTSAPCFAVEDGSLVLKSRPQERKKAVVTSQSFAKRIKGVARTTELYTLAVPRLRQILMGNRYLAIGLGHLGIDLNPGYLPHIVAGWFLSEHADRGFELTKHLVLRLSEEVSADGAHLAVVIIPSRIQVISELFELSKLLYPDSRPVMEFLEDQSRPQRLVREFLEVESIPTLDLLPLLIDSGGGGKLYGAATSHWNASGHRLAAASLDAFLRDQRLIPTEPLPGPPDASDVQSQLNRR